MKKVTREAALEYHTQGKPGKIEVVPTKPAASPYDLSLAYSPGVAEPCLEIQKNPDDAYRYTTKGNLVAVITNGTSILGLGDIGAMAGKPVMEGKAILFKIYSGIDVFDIEVNEKDPAKFVKIVKAIAPTFGGINLEDIKAPECFYIEKRLKKELDIPIMHDDQHGTAIITSAALLNAAELSGKSLHSLKVVVSGAGAAAIMCSRMYKQLGVCKRNILMFDSKGLITTRRTDLSREKREFAVNYTRELTLADAMKGADLFLGLSRGNLLTNEMVLSMAPRPIIFALANPVPEIDYDTATSLRSDLIMGTGRSDYPNQINNVLGFPYLFRGALDTQARCINEEMKVAAVRALAQLAKEPVPDEIKDSYNDPNLTFGPGYLIPKPNDTRLLPVVASAVALAATASGVARKPISNTALYRRLLKEMIERSNRADCCVVRLYAPPEEALPCD